MPLNIKYWWWWVSDSNGDL